MDPDVTLKMIAWCLDDGEDPDLHCQYLWDWLKAGGLEPFWERYPTATSYYECRAIHHNRGERVQE